MGSHQQSDFADHGERVAVGRRRAHEQGFQTAFVPRPDERRPGHGAEPAPSYGLTARDFLDLAVQLGC